jgi:hypothetical protein
MRVWRAPAVAAAIGGILIATACTPVRTKSGSQAAGGKSGSGGRTSSAAGSGGTESQAGSESTNTSGPLLGGAGERSGQSGGEKNSGTEKSNAGTAGMDASPAAGNPAAGGGGTSGTAGAAPASAGPIRGVLLDALQRPLKNVSLRVGDQNVTTDELGKFTVEHADAEYDVSFKLTTTVDEKATTYAWRFEGLTRRDPKLVVYPSGEIQGTNLTWHTKGATFPFQDDQRMLAGFGSPDGDFTVGVNQPDYESPLVYWTGPETTTGVTHGLMFSVAGADDLPIEYLAHDAKPLTLSVGTDSEATFDFTNTKPASGMITGRVASRGQGDRQNFIVMRWIDGASATIAVDSAATDAFSYLVPTIANGSASLIAMAGRWDQFPRSAAYADNLSAGQNGISLEILPAPSVNAPGDGATGVDAKTAFQWAGEAKVFVFVAEVKKDAYDAMYVVTSEKETRLPIGEATGYTPPAGTTFNWYVETHNAYASMDEAAGGEGLIGAYFDGRLHGPRRGRGTYTVSELRTFVTKP